MDFESQDVILEKNLTDIGQFFACLSPEVNYGIGYHGAIFRGQADAAWELQPSCLRYPNTSVAIHEFNLLRDFYDACDNAGLILPQNAIGFSSQHQHHEALKRTMSEDIAWPPQELHNFLALAQHHGVPTRLLDWSKRAHVAAYFAASSALDGERIYKEQQLAIWILTDLAEKHLRHIGMQIVKVPGSTSLNLAAQHGMFTLLSPSGKKIGDPDFEHLNRVLIRAHADGDPRIFTPSLIKITIPAHYSGLILHQCNLYGINASALFPGYDGAAKEARDQANIIRHARRQDN